MAEKLIKTESPADPMEVLRNREAELLSERLELLEAENAALRAKKNRSQNDPRSRAIAAQMNNLEDAPKKGIIHISEFERHGIDYKGKEEDVANLEAARDD